jgi:hypothetical protein
MQEDPTAWAAYVKMAVKDRVHVPMNFEIPGLESPLGARLMRRASRPGDGVAYGQHGPWGAYREGVKEMSEKINKGKFTAMEAHLLLEQEGVHALAPEEAKLPGGVMSDHVYYKFLDQSDMTSADVKPLESDRDLWLTSKVRDRLYM